MADQTVYEDEVYGRAPLQGEVVDLRVNVYLPAAAEAPVPLLVWWHSGAFRHGRYTHVSHRKLARWLTRMGIALATPEYRQKSRAKDMSPEVRARKKALDGLRDLGFRRNLSGAMSLVAMEDAVAVVNWLEARRERFGFQGPMVLGGSSAGAITAFNVAFTAPFVGLSRPEPGGLISYSGGYAYPGLYQPGKYPVFAVHNPADDRVEIGSIRALCATDPAARLIESDEQRHGDVAVYRADSRAQTFGRLGALVREMGTGGAAAAG